MEHIRAGKGPMLLEMVTYRYRGHSMSDPAKYRSKEEVEMMREQHDPIENIRRVILAERIATEDDLKAMEKEIRETVNQSADFAQQSPEPDPSELWTDVLKD